MAKPFTPKIVTANALLEGDGLGVFVLVSTSAR